MHIWNPVRFVTYCSQQQMYFANSTNLTKSDKSLSNYNNLDLMQQMYFANITNLTRLDNDTDMQCNLYGIVFIDCCAALHELAF